MKPPFVPYRQGSPMLVAARSQLRAKELQAGAYPRITATAAHSLASRNWEGVVPAARSNREAWA